MTRRNTPQYAAQAIPDSLKTLSMQTVKQIVPMIAGKIGDNIRDWFSIAERIARRAGWDDIQKLRYFEDRLEGLALTFSEN